MTLLLMKYFIQLIYKVYSFYSSEKYSIYFAKIRASVIILLSKEFNIPYRIKIDLNHIRLKYVNHNKMVQ